MQPTSKQEFESGLARYMGKWDTRVAGPGGNLKCGEDDWDGLRALFRETRVKEDQHDDCDASGQRHVEEVSGISKK